MISDRKLEHLLICKNYDVEFKNKKTGFEDVELIHKALPEIDKNEIDLSTSVFGKKLDSPLFITAITGGHPAAKAINKQLAIAAESKNIALVDELYAQGLIEKRFNTVFFTNGDSKIPEYAGLYSAMIGSVLTLIITMIVAFPIGVMTAIYLEEFAGDNKFTRFIEININNLAAIPSILFGL